MSCNADPACAKRRASPTYAGCRPASALASRTKRSNRKTGTKAEVALRKALWRRGLRYRLNRRDLPGAPDIVFVGTRIVVFVDGDFWHGRNWSERKQRLESGSNSDYWVSKIGYNRERDERNNAKLTGLGWRILRFWETDVLSDPDAAAAIVMKLVRSDRVQREGAKSSAHRERS
jgi:DNA mismatch endonuclease, patch repair protein